MSVDLTGTGILPASSVGCETFASASIKSRSSGATGTFNSDLKDIVIVRKALTNCGTIQLKKHWVGATGTVNLNIGTTAGASNIATAARAPTATTPPQSPLRQATTSSPSRPPSPTSTPRSGASTT